MAERVETVIRASRRHFELIANCTAWIGGSEGRYVVERVEITGTSIDWQSSGPAWDEPHTIDRGSLLWAIAEKYLTEEGVLDVFGE